MSALNLTAQESLRFVPVLDPDSYAASAHTGAWVSLVGFQRVVILVQSGDGLTNPVAVKLQEATDSSGTGKQDIEGKTATFTDTDDDGWIALEIANHELSEGFTHVTLVATPDTSAAELSAMAIQMVPHSVPVDNSDAVDFV